MTSANVFNWTAVNSNQTLNANAATSRSKADNPEAASMFASMMTPNYSTNSGMEMSSQSGRNKSETAPAGAYDRYQYRDNSIDRAENPDIQDKIEQAAEELAGFEEKVTKAVAEELGISEEQVVQVMEDLGLTAFDLMDPQNLVQLTMALTGAADSAQLLTEPLFLDLMQEIGVASEQLMDVLEIPVEQMDELIARMDVLEQPVALADTEFAAVMEQAVSEDVTAEKVVPVTETVSAEQIAPQEQVLAAAHEMTEQETVEADSASDVSEQPVMVSTDEPLQEETADAGTDAGTDSFEADGRTSARTADSQEKPHSVGIQPVITELTAQGVEQIAKPEAEYLSVDTLDVIEQIAEKVRVGISEGTSSIEMQLNPEHLGRVYLQISAKQGAVNAQIAAANEAVKNALETQVATLRESLEQAGVKVDAIEVTIASHGFEKNLEQNQQQAKQEGERADQQSHRRNLNLSSLDELSGVMSEEEALVAQIMKDNGNSVDLTA